MDTDGLMPLVAGPCLAESPELVETVAAALAGLRERYGVAPVLKASFDKANRSSASAARGPGLAALPWLGRIAEAHGLPLCVDIHLPEQAGPAAEVAAVLQIPALLCRQTDLLGAAARSGRPVLLKRGPFLSPRQTRVALEKLQQLGGTEVLVAERGSSFGYERLVVDPTAIDELAREGWPVLIDASHAVQAPGGLGHETGGHLGSLPAVARAGLAAGACGVFLETHPNPAAALSDRHTQIPVDQLERLVEHLLPLWNTLQELPAFALEENT